MLTRTGEREIGAASGRVGMYAGVIFFCFFGSRGEKITSSSRKQITEIKGEGMIAGYRELKLCGSSLDFEFIREYMKTNKIHPKFQFWTKIEIKMIYQFVFCYLLSLRLKSHLEAVLSTFKILSCTIKV